MPAPVRRHGDVEFEVVFSGRESLTDGVEGLGSTLSGHDFTIARGRRG